MERKKNPKADLENKRSLFFMIGMVVALGLILFAFEWKTYDKEMSSLGTLEMEDLEEEIIPITEQTAPPPPPPPKPQQQEIMEIVEDDEEIEQELEVDDAEATSTTEIFELPPEKVIEEPEIFTVVEDMPVFPGCESAKNKEACTNEKIFAYISQNTKYPPMAKDNGQSGTVFIRFVVNQDGRVSDVEVIRGVPGGPSLDREAVRVVKTMPKMQPGKQRGQAVRVQYNVPVKFSLRGG